MSLAGLPAVDKDALGNREPGRAERGFRVLLVHGKRGREHSRMRVGDFHQLQEALHTAIFAPAAVQRVESGVRLCLAQALSYVVADIYLCHLEAFIA